MLRRREVGEAPMLQVDSTRSQELLEGRIRVANRGVGTKDDNARR